MGLVAPLSATTGKVGGISEPGSTGELSARTERAEPKQDEKTSVYKEPFPLLTVTSTSTESNSEAAA